MAQLARLLEMMVVGCLSGVGAIALADAIAAMEPATQPAVQFAQRQSRPGRADWLRGLNLTPDQVQQIQDIRRRYQARLTTERQAVRQAQQELNQLMTSNASADQIRQKFEQVQILKEKLGDTRLESMLAIRNVLNVEQRQKLNEVIRQMGRDR
jgi:Spy/CpxP family protein refolding chaperone